MKQLISMLHIFNNNNNSKSFEYKGKSLGNTVADRANGILRNSTITVPLKF